MSDTNTKPAVYVGDVSFTEAQIEEMKQGSPLSGSSRRPSQSFPINEGLNNVMPVIRDESGTPIRQEKVTKANFSHHTTAAEEAQRKANEAVQATQDRLKELQVVIDPNQLYEVIQKLQASAAALDRKVRSQAKLITKLEGDVNALREVKL